MGNSFDEKFKSYPTPTLIVIATSSPSEYQEDVIEAARNELRVRGESWHSLKALATTSRFVRGVWRIFSIVILFFGVLSLFDLAARPTRPDPILFIGLLIFGGGLITAWRRECLGGIIARLAIGTMELAEYYQGKFHPDLVEYVVWVVGMLPLLSWTLDTVKKPNVPIAIRLFSRIILPLIMVAIGFCIYQMTGARFNP